MRRCARTCVKSAIAARNPSVWTSSVARRTCRQQSSGAGVGVGVVVSVFRRHAGGEIDFNDVLMIKRGKPPYLGYWSLPGGAIEWGEPHLESARREMAEETGVSIDAHSAFAVTDAILLADDSQTDDREKVAYHHVLVHVVGTVSTLNGGDAAVAGDDATAAEWLPVADLPKLDRLIPTTHMLVRQAAEALKRDT